MNITEAFKTDIRLFKNSSGDLSTISGLSNLKKALFDRLMTIKGTLVHRPTYGVGVAGYLNGLNSFSKQQRLASDINEQFLEDPRVEEVTSVAVISTDASPQNVTIKVFVKPVGYSETEMEFTPFGGSV